MIASRPFQSTVCAIGLALALCFATIASSAAEDEATWRINLQDAEIGEFIAQVARITGRNFVVDPRVNGRVTIISSAALDTEGVYELFQSVLRVHGFAAVPAGDVVKIVQQTVAKQSSSGQDFEDDVEGETMITRVIGATNVASSELVKILRPLIPQYSHVAAVDSPNVVILSDHAENIRRMERIIAEIDVAQDDIVEVVVLENAWVENLVSLLEKLAPDRIGSNAQGPNAIQLVANARNNSLVLRGKGEPVADIQSLIRRLDVPSNMTGATRVFRLEHSEAEELAAVLESVVANQLSDAEQPITTSISPDASLNALVVRGDPTTMTEITRIIEALDVRRTQVLIEAAIVEVSMNDSSSLGADFAIVDESGEASPLFVSPLNQALAALLTGAVPEATEETAAAAAELDLLGTAAQVTSPTLAVAKLSSGVSFGAILQALSTNNDSNLLSTPSVLTLDNEEASILVGQEVPFRSGSFTTTTDGANNPFTTIQRENVGITLRVVPRINDGNAVRLEVEQEVSSVVNANVSNSGFSDIVTNKRTINTVILADDQQTIVLGGLIQDDIIQTRSKVPLLGDIPIAGRLFRNDSSERVKRNLLVFLRPTILRNATDVAEVTETKYGDVWEVQPAVPEEAVRPEIEALYKGRPDPSRQQ